MKERNKPTKSFIARCTEEIEKEAFKEGYEAGFSKACEMFHDFAEVVCKMRGAQKKVRGYSPLRCEQERCQWENDLDNKTYLEDEVDTWIKENYPHLMEG